MKITRRQLRRIINETASVRQKQEAAYAVIYTTGYLDASDAGLGRLLRQNPKLGEMGENWIPLDDALSDVHVSLITGARSIKRENPELDLSEENSVLREGQAAGQADFNESIYKYVEQIESLVNRQTPMGMSAAEGLRVFGIATLKPGLSMADTAINEVRHLISLMDDDNVLSWLDEVEAMKQYGELVQ